MSDDLLTCHRPFSKLCSCVDSPRRPFGCSLDFLAMSLYMHIISKQQRRPTFFRFATTKTNTFFFFHCILLLPSVSGFSYKLFFISLLTKNLGGSREWREVGRLYIINKKYVFSLSCTVFIPFRIP